MSKKGSAYGVLFENEDINIDLINNPCTVSYSEDRHLKKAGEKITLAQMTGFLELLKWDVIHVGCDNFAIRNHKKERMTWTLEERHGGLQMRPWNDEALFGTQAYSGFMYMILDDADMRFSDHTIFISFGNPKKGGLTIFLSNIDKVFEPHEQYEFDLPKEYQARLRCSECGALVLKSKPLSGLEYINNRFAMHFSGALCSPACPKCKTSTYSDMNAHTDRSMYRIKTGRPVTDKTIEQESAEHVKMYNKLVDEYRDREREKERKRKAEKEAKKQEEAAPAT